MKKMKLSLIMTCIVTSCIFAQETTTSNEVKGVTNSKDVVFFQNDYNEGGGKDKDKKNAKKEDKTIGVYPNPAKDLVTLQGVKLDDQIVIIDEKGKNRLQIKAKAEVEIIPIDFLESGIYTLLINNEKRKLIVE
ncbi:conserved exported hypothetical protein [Flavobacterium sp. 9AF]|uniref:T9SS type A sorting domain-containing protein n=1 Tax=Flavobacterium sp. 9AF TaxID=2653142 RepID=UPI0012F21CD4|nr:T9SS type A sorting domain-containing protein [Flavobacterium sp. 9AF]VXB64447.1 conserved exported hypothetical protein [Flavobacterium sp. 9AF]